MRQRGWFAVIVALALSFIAATPAHATVTAGASVSDVNAAGAKLNQATKAYIQSAGETPPTNSAQWKQFFDHENKLVSTLKSRFKEWSTTLDSAVHSGHRPPGYQNVLTYRSALKTWIADQSEQLHLSRGCYLTSNGFANLTDAAACYQQVLSDNGDRWNADAAILNESLPSK